MRAPFSDVAGFSLLFDCQAVLESHEGSRRLATFPLADAEGWECVFKAAGSSCGGSRAIWHGEFSAHLRGGTARSATVGLRFDFRGWTPEVYVLGPGAVYAGNRFPAMVSTYPPGIPRSAVCAGLPIQTEVPRLRYEPGPSCLRQMSSDFAFPGLGFFFPESQTGLWVLTSAVNEHGLFGFELEESEDRTRASLTVFTPGMTREFEYEICNDRVPSTWRARDLKAGEIFRIPFYLECFPCASPQGLFDRIPELRRKMVPPPRVRHDIPFSEVWRILEDKFLRENWVEPQGYYAIGVEPMRSRTYTQNWQMGWTGGMIIPHALFLRGSEEAARRALRNFDFVFPRGQAPSGYFYANGDGEHFYPDDTQFPQEHRSLVRKNADGLFYMLATLEAAEARGLQPRPAWLQGLRACAEAFVRTWRCEGQWGQFVNHETGEVVIPGSAGGGLVPAALIRAGRRFAERRSEYLRVAREAAKAFEENYLARGFTNGGPGDAAQCADSESLAGLLESFVTLHEETGGLEWLEAARRAATHVASWTVSYDFPFPPESTFGKLGMLANGTVLANAQNKHSAPGICTHSGLPLLRLFRLTGEAWIMDLLRDIAHTLPQYMSRADRPIPWTIPYNLPDDPSETTLRPGWMCERVNLTYWGGHEKPGEVFYYSCWSEVALLLTIAELPGIYAQPGRAWSLDHVEAWWEGGRLWARNPTAWPARFSFLVETPEHAAACPWPRANIQTASLKPGEKQALS